jgi:hypothetical protein
VPPLPYPFPPCWIVGIGVKRRSQHPAGFGLCSPIRLLVIRTTIHCKSCGLRLRILQLRLNRKTFSCRPWRSASPQQSKASTTRRFPMSLAPGDIGMQQRSCERLASGCRTAGAERLPHCTPKKAASPVWRGRASETRVAASRRHNAKCFFSRKSTSHTVHYGTFTLVSLLLQAVRQRDHPRNNNYRRKRSWPRSYAKCRPYTGPRS